MIQMAKDSTAKTPDASRLLFGSCNSQHHTKQPLWPSIQSRNATAFVWGGDVVYGDDRMEWHGCCRKRLLGADPPYLGQLLDDMKHRNPGYKSLLESGIEIFGTVDDHDYGINNGDRTYPWKVGNAVEFVNFLGLPQDSPMTKRAEQGLGVYGVQVYDFDRPRGQQLLSDVEAGLDDDLSVVSVDDGRKNETHVSLGPKTVAVFVLDIRSNKSPSITSIPARFREDFDGDFLGPEQLRWFRNTIGRSTVACNIIVNGLQVHPQRFFDGSKIEEWARYPMARHHLYQAILQPNVRAPVIVSGDVHHAQFLRKDCRRQPKHSFRQILEVTTSGMTHSWGSNELCGRANMNPLCHMYFFKRMAGTIVKWSHEYSAWPFLIKDKDGNLQYTLELNFAEFEFDWEAQSLHLKILGTKVAGSPLLSVELTLDELTNLSPAQTRVSDFDFETEQRHLNVTDEDFICVDYRGLANPFHYYAAIALTMSLVSSAMFLTFCSGPILALIVYKRRRSSRQQKVKES